MQSWQFHFPDARSSHNRRGATVFNEVIAAVAKSDIRHLLCLSSLATQGKEEGTAARLWHPGATGPASCSETGMFADEADIWVGRQYGPIASRSFWVAGPLPMYTDAARRMKLPPVLHPLRSPAGNSFTLEQEFELIARRSS